MNKACRECQAGLYQAIHAAVGFTCARHGTTELDLIQIAVEKKERARRDLDRAVTGLGAVLLMNKDRAVDAKVREVLRDIGGVLTLLGGPPPVAEPEIVPVPE